MRFIGVFNRDGGTFRTLDMDQFIERATAIFAEHGHELDSRPVEGSGLIAALEQAAADGTADVLLAGGGDGTISAAAGVCFSTGKTLAVLPAGTMNFFARTLKIPLNIEEALHAIAAGQPYAVDIATANGRPFVHQYAVGLYARLVRIREELPYSNRWEKMLASVKSVAGAIRKRLKFAAEVRTSRGMERRLASGIVVSNNLLAEGHMPHADDVDGGVLGVYIAKPMTAGDALRLVVLLMLGRWKGHPRVSEKEVTAVTLSFPRIKRSARAVIDGELIRLAPKVALRIHPGALKVFAPAALAAVTGAKVTDGDVPNAEPRDEALTP